MSSLNRRTASRKSPAIATLSLRALSMGCSTSFSMPSSLAGKISLRMEATRSSASQTSNRISDNWLQSLSCRSAISLLIRSSFSIATCPFRMASWAISNAELNVHSSSSCMRKDKVENEKSSRMQSGSCGSRRHSFAENSEMSTSISETGLPHSWNRT